MDDDMKDAAGLDECLYTDARPAQNRPESIN